MKMHALAGPFLAAALLVTACQTAPEPVAATPEPAAEPEPVDVPEPPDPDVPLLNEWGGEVPLSVPTSEVSEEGLEDLR